MKSISPEKKAYELIGDWTSITWEHCNVTGISIAEKIITDMISSIEYSLLEKDPFREFYFTESEKTSVKCDLFYWQEVYYYFNKIIKNLIIPRGFKSESLEFKYPELII